MTSTTRSVAPPAAGPPAAGPSAAVPSAAGAPVGRPLRRDAERNRLLILDAAGELYAGRGLDVGFDEIARRAGVGVGTVYRRFPDREDLVEALFERRLSSIVDLAVQAGQHPDPWEGFCAFLAQSTAMQVADRGLRQVMVERVHGRESVAVAMQRLLPAVGVLVERAQATGELRADVRTTDLAALSTMLSSASTPADPDLWRRYLVLALDGLREDRGRTTTLPRDAPPESTLRHLGAPTAPTPVTS